MAGVEHVIFRMGVGEEVWPYRNCADRAGFVITCAARRTDALAAAEEACRRIVIATEPPVLVA